MQTFLPHPDFEKSVATLDTRRVFNQVNECKSIAIALLEKRGWIHHPATKMWGGYLEALALYAHVANDNARRRGRETNPAMEYFYEKVGVLGETPEMPPWFGDVVFHRSHQSALNRKGIGRFDMVPSDTEYAWPRLNGAGGYTLELSTAGAKRVKMGVLRDPREVFKGWDW